MPGAELDMSVVEFGIRLADTEDVGRFGVQISRKRAHF
jgi:hypothetical protein